MSFRNIRGSEFPSPAARATRDWAQYTDRVDIPALVLMENMGAEGSNVAFLGTSNLDLLLSPGRGPDRTEVVNSQVLHVSLGEPHTTVREPVEVVFRHISHSNMTRPRCVAWDAAAGAWDGARCVLQATNATHSHCQCSVLGTLALLETVKVEDDLHKVTLMLTLIVTVTVTVVSAISLALLIFYCKKVKVYRN